MSDASEQTKEARAKVLKKRTRTRLQIRDEFVDMIRRELLGPAGCPDERVDERYVRDRYALGMLAPRNASKIPDPEDEDGPLATDQADTPEEGYAEQELPGFGAVEAGESDESSPQKSMIPSSIGLTFALSRAADALKVTVRWGVYVRRDDEEADEPTKYWQRIPIEASTIVSVNELHESESNRWDWTPSAAHPDVMVRGLVRDHEDAYTITTFLTNGKLEPKDNKDSAWLFQPEIIVEEPAGQPAFIRRKLPDGLTPTEVEDNIMRMIYREKVEFAVGHGVAVHAELPDGRWDVAWRISTKVLPRAEVLRMEPPVIEDLTVDMKTLAETDMGSFGPLLTPLVVEYEAWIAEKAAHFEDEPEQFREYRKEREKVEADWVEALERIRAGIALLDADADAARAFQFANRAMWLQRIRTIYSGQARQGDTPDLAEIDKPVNRSWRPFQLAFILLNLPAMTDPTHPERSSTDPDKLGYADLLWFPTGGGKTEAYLGLTAYTLAIRRLQGEVGGLDGMAGVAVLMRYTLRLLTLQQFQRATALIAACEVIRRDDPGRWGKRPFRIGLWVGMRSTPNWTKDSDEAIRRSHGHGWHSGSSIGGRGTPVQLTHCPWCGNKIDPGRNIKVETPEKGRGRTFQFCGDRLGECEFSRSQSPDEGLPIVVVDEEIYRLLPDLLIATVDKFARMPWRGQTQMLFGRVTHYCKRHGYVSPEFDDTGRHRAKRGLPAVEMQPSPWLRPPDLIIQDELHLISGPLGTLVGLYETAVETLCCWELDGATIRPKVVASTATIRRAQQQVKNIFDRQVKIFPPTGTDSEDNFFSQIHPSTADRPGRLYMGVCATGTRFKTIMIRVYVAAMAAAQKLLEYYGVERADPYMTLVGYFSSMRELGGMRRVVDDSVSSRLKRMDERGLSRRFININGGIDELTSRKGAVEIPETLTQLETRFDVPAEKGKRRRSNNRKGPLDALLATNMISVGVDVSRLGLMVVASQPKHTAEYIQATSRVGRQFPGLVLTVYNWARPRDVSHYERFEHYHETFYQQVEPLSVTPFASRALDRGLSGVLVSLVRLASEKYNDNKSAGEILQADDELTEAREAIVQRAGDVANSALPQVERLLEHRIGEWRKQAANRAAILGYEGKKDGNTVGLLAHSTGQPWEPFTCLNSLRDVEPEVRLIHDDHDMEERVMAEPVLEDTDSGA
ncbi:MAG: DISARM system helicase DrmA [Chloroflexi bacterium]|nr:DISARM system helicase DrmA [Chloroflexota bacterium]